MRRPSAGALRERVTFRKREDVDDGFGGTQGQWVDQFTEPAGLVPRLGSEPVVASRLQGIQPYTLTIRSSQRSRQITPAWQAKNARTGVLYDIKAITNPDGRNAWLELLVVEGSAS